MEVQIVSSLAEVSSVAWNALRSDDFPFSRFEHLRALEATGCLGERTGWHPQYVLWSAREPDSADNGESTRPQAFRAATWFYKKTNSYGEFVFDHEWVDLYERLGYPYYPKLVGAVPFTPATGTKLLGEPSLRSDLVSFIGSLSERRGMSSGHILFIPDRDRAVYEDAGWVLRSGIQFHWRNRDFRDFGDFLSQLKKKRRKEISYERRNIDADLDIQCLEGSDLTTEAADFAYELYQKTNLDKYSLVCLTRDYFQQIFAVMKPFIRFFVARRKSHADGRGRLVAGALFLCEGKRMFGRYWGAKEDLRYLHFELCYYAPIELAIAQGIEELEAGAQGAHKMSRGFLPTLTQSAHRFAIPKIHEVFKQYCEHERSGLETALAEHQEHYPYLEGNDVTIAGSRA